MPESALPCGIYKSTIIDRKSETTAWCAIPLCRAASSPPVQWSFLWESLRAAARPLSATEPLFRWGLRPAAATSPCMPNFRFPFPPQQPRPAPPVFRDCALLRTTREAAPCRSASSARALLSGARPGLSTRFLGRAAWSAAPRLWKTPQCCAPRQAKLVWRMAQS